MLVAVEMDVHQSSEAAAVGPTDEEEEDEELSARGIQCGGAWVGTVPLSDIIGPGSVLLTGPSVSGVSVAMETRAPASSRPFPNKPGQT